MGAHTPVGLRAATRSPPTTQELPPTPWQRGTNRSVLGGCLQAVAGSCYGAWQACERSPPEEHCQQLAAPTRLACRVSLPILFPESKGGWMDTHGCVFGHVAAAPCRGGCQRKVAFLLDCILDTLLPMEHAPPARSTVAALLLPRGGNPSAQVTKAAFLISPANASEKASAAHLTQKHSMVPTSKLDALGMLLLQERVEKSPQNSLFAKLGYCFVLGFKNRTDAESHPVPTCK